MSTLDMVVQVGYRVECFSTLITFWHNCHLRILLRIARIFWCLMVQNISLNMNHVVRAHREYFSHTLVV